MLIFIVNQNETKINKIDKIFYYAYNKMDETGIYIVNILYVVFIISIIGMSYYFYGTSAMIFTIFVLILFTIISLYVSYLNLKYDLEMSCNRTILTDSSLNDPKEKIAKQTNEIKEDKIKNIDLSNSKLHNID